MNGDQMAPPRLSQWLIEATSRRLGTPDLPADAAELFAERAQADAGAARRWYRRQARSALRSWLLAWLRPGSVGLPLAGLSLNARLGGRMMVKHPGVTVVGVLAMAIGIGIGAGYLEIVRDFLEPTLPLEDGERIVGLRNWNAAEGDPAPRALHDFATWRRELRSIRDLAAFRTVERNLGGLDAAPEPALGAEMTASGFGVARVPALLGRTLVEADETPGAEPMVVLSHALWQRRFAGAPGVVGRTVRLGDGTATVAGVMPAGFAFPVNHEFWVPLTAASTGYGPGEGPAVQLFGRLADGMTLGRAQAELSALGARAAVLWPATHAQMRPVVMKYAELFVGGGGGGVAMYSVVLLFVMLLLVLASNVATMVFARTASRESEIAMRFALGASRAQLLVQFFVEAFVLALVATALGLGVVAWGAQWGTRMLWQVSNGGMPFWLDGRLNVSTVLYALVLAVVGSLVAGVLPACRVTGAKLQSRIRHPSAGAGEGSLQFGGLWTAVIAVQVAFAVLLIPPAVVAISSWAEPQRADAGFPTGEYLSARLALDALEPLTDSTDAAAFLEVFEATKAELRRRLLDVPEVSGVTFATALPGMDHQQATVALDIGETALAMISSVDPAYFDAFGATIAAGRSFTQHDLQSTPLPVVVNQAFVAEALPGGGVVGRRIRWSGNAEGPGYEIVGVVSNLGMDTDRDPFHGGTGPGVYFPLTASAARVAERAEVRLAFHVRGDAAAFAPQLRDLARSVNPALRMHDVLPLDQPIDAGNRTQRLVTRFFTTVTAFVAVVALLISAAGIYSVLAFTVARQTREIGIRIALGADRRRIVRSIFSRAMIQIGAGILIGSVLWLYVFTVVLGGGDRFGLLLATAAVLCLVGIAACGVPVHRALRIEPMEALREG